HLPPPSCPTRRSSDLHDFRHRRMLVRIPVRRREGIVDLSRGEARRASLEVMDLAVIRRTLLALRLRIGPCRRRLTLSADPNGRRSEVHTSELQSRVDL